MKQKVFRIEQMIAGGAARAHAHPQSYPHAHPHDHGHDHRHIVDELKALRVLAEQRDSSAIEAVDGLKRELTTFRDAVARNRHELDLLINDGKERRMARAADELRASVDDMDHATQKILSSAEQIDDKARALTASLKTGYERGLAQDVQDHVVQIYETCNFQDLTGQRISNVLGVMTMLEDRIGDMLDRFSTLIGSPQISQTATPAPKGELLNGPKLDDDSGHASQTDIDALFSCPVA